MHSFAQRLITWQCSHGRHDLPWQGQDAYRVWLSEIMLQQTQVATVIPYYQRFIATFPNIAALAAATEDQVLAHWSGLGYYARGRNLHKAAQIIAEKHHGEFPREFEQIIELPGIGRSTAAAICALAYHERRAILDGNVKRVLARYCGIEGWAGEKKVEERLWQQAELLLPPPPSPHALSQREREFSRAGEGVETSSTSTPPSTSSGQVELTFPQQGGRDDSIATYTQALMDMGATICTRSKPKCVLCPVQADCVALQTERIAKLPSPRPRKAVPERQSVFLLLMHGNDILLERRPGSGIWGGLWCPPQFEDEIAARDWFLRSGMEARGGERLAMFTHTFTHFKLHITPLKVELARKPVRAAQSGSVWLEVGEALGAAIPTPVRAMLSGLIPSPSGRGLG